MGVLGVIFDCKLTWSAQVLNAINNSNRALSALRLIKRYIDQNSMRSLLISNYYSVLYYNSEIWLSKNLNNDCKQQLLSSSANALRTCLPMPNPHISFLAIHKHNKISTPEHIGNFKLAILLFKTFNSNERNKDWHELADQIIITRRQANFDCYRTNNYKIGLNVLINKFYVLKQKIPLKHFNLSLPVFKHKMKSLLKPNE